MKKEIKYQCVHTDSGLCETCFKYETQIAHLTARVGEAERVLRVIAKSECSYCLNRQRAKEALATVPAEEKP